MSNSIAEAFKKLNVTPGADSSEHEKIFSVSYDYLSKVKDFNDLKAFKNCLTSLINLDRYHKAHEIIRKVPQELRASLILEVSYIYYKLGRSDDLLALYHETTIDNDGLQVGLKHILAQNYYKIGEYEKALELYRDLIENNKYDSKLDLVVNERSVISQLNFYQNKGLTSKYNIEEYGENYDLFFNEALIELSNKNLDGALDLLERAERICESQNAGFSQAELLIEVLPIKLTRAHLYELQGDSTKSLALLKETDIDTVDDTIIKLIIKNNLYALQPPSGKTSINLTDRDLSYQVALQKLGQKLTKFQYQIIKKNSLLLKYATETLSSSQINNQFTNQYTKDFAGDLTPLIYKVLLKTEISFDELHDSVQQRALTRKIRTHLTSVKKVFSEEYIATVLLLLYVSSDSIYYDDAVTRLEEAVESNFQQAKLVPGLVGTLLQAYETRHRYDDKNKRPDILLKSIKHIMSTEAKVLQDDLHYYSFARTIAFRGHASVESDVKEESRTLLEFLLSIKQDQLVNAVVNNVAEGLLPVSQLASTQSIEELVQNSLDTEFEQKPLVKQPIKASKVVKKKSKRAPVFSKTKVLKPEGEFEVDQERWLPLKLRSYYKPTRKEKKKVGGGHQGALEVGGNSNTASPAPTSAPTTSSSEKKKKKKKGKK